MEAVKELGQHGGDGERLQLLLEDKASKSENWVNKMKNKFKFFNYTVHR